MFAANPVTDGYLESWSFSFLRANLASWFVFIYQPIECSMACNYFKLQLVRIRLLHCRSTDNKLLSRWYTILTLSERLFELYAISTSRSFSDWIGPDIAREHLSHTLRHRNKTTNSRRNSGYPKTGWAVGLSFNAVKALSCFFSKSSYNI